MLQPLRFGYGIHHESIKPASARTLRAGHTMEQAFQILKVNGTSFEINTQASEEFSPSSTPPQLLIVDLGILLKLLFHQKKLYRVERKCFKHTVMLAKTVSFS